MRVALMAAMMTAFCHAQDEGKKEGAKQDGRKEARDAAAKALKATAAKGAFAFEGEAKMEYSQEEEGGFAVPDLGGFHGGLQGKITGTASSPFKATIRAKSDKAVYEAWHDKVTIERMTWRGFGQSPGDGANDVFSLVNLEKLAEAAGKAREAKAGADEKVGDAACKTWTLVLDGSAVGSYLETPEAPEEDPNGDMVMSIGMKATRVELKIWVGDDGVVRKLESKIVKGWDMPGAEEGEEEEEGEEQLVMTSTYVFTLSKFGEAKVEIPEEIRAQMGK